MVAWTRGCVQSRGVGDECPWCSDERFRPRRRARSRRGRPRARAQEMVGAGSGDRGRGDDLRRRQSADAALQVGSARPDRRARERVLPPRYRPRHGPRPHHRPGSGDQPGAARALARSGAPGGQAAEARRAAGIRRGAARRVAGALFARLSRACQGPARNDRRGARARGLLRAADRVSGRQVARDLDRIPIGRSRARRQGRQHHRGQLPDHAADRAPGSDPRGRALARRRDRHHAQARGRSRGQGGGIPLQDQPVHRHQQHLAVEPDARRVRTAISRRRARRRQTSSRRRA